MEIVSISKTNILSKKLVSIFIHFFQNEPLSYGDTLWYYLVDSFFE